MEKWFVNKNVLYLSLSAFFADAGYQAVIALFPYTRTEPLLGL